MDGVEIAGLVDPAAAASNWGGPQYRMILVPRLLHVGTDVNSLLGGAPRVDGGFFRALAYRVDGPVHAFVTTRESQVYFGKRLNFNPTRRNGGWTCASCRIQTLPGRGLSTSLRCRGVLSLWIKESELGVIYHDGRLVMQWIEANWSISNAERNRLMHALNGNIHPDVAVDMGFAEGNYFAPLLWNSDILCMVCDECSSLIQLARATDIAGPEGSLLTDGPRFVVKGLFKKRDAKKRSKSSQSHSNQRNNKTLAELAALLDDDGVETWCRFHRPRPEDVPDRDHDYIKAYRSGGTRTHARPGLEDEWQHHMLVRWERLRQDLDLDAAFKRLFARLPGVEDACKYHASLNGNNGSATNTDDHAMRVNMLEHMNTGDMITAALSDLHNHHLANPVFNLYGQIGVDPLVQADMPTVMPLLAAGGVNVAFELGQHDVLLDGYYITRGYLNAYREGDDAYRHEFRGQWLVDVEVHTTAAIVNHLVQEPAAILNVGVPTANGLRYPRLLRKIVTTDPATGGVRPDWTVLYVFYTDGLTPMRFPNKTMLVANDAGRAFSAIVGPHNCVLHDNMTGTLNFISKATYNDMLRNYTSGQSLLVVRRNTLAMYRQGRDQLLTPEAATAWCDYFACYATPMLLRAATSHHPLRSRLITDAFNGTLSWRWWGWWDPYAYDRNWGMAVETHPIPPWVRYATFACLAWKGSGFVHSRFQDLSGYVSKLSAPTIALPQVTIPTVDVVTPAVAVWNSSWTRDLLTGNIWMRMRESYMTFREFRNELRWETLSREAALVKRALALAPETTTLDVVDGARKVVKPFLPASAIEPGLQIGLGWVIPMAGVVVGVAGWTAHRRRWFPDYTSGPMGRWSEFWRRLPVVMHRAARLVKWTSAPNQDGNLVYQTLPSFAHSQFASHAKGTQNYIHSFCMRVGRVTPDPLPHMIRAYESAFESLTEAFNGVPVFPTHWPDFVARFPPAKRKDYEEARELFETWGVRLWEGRRNRLLNRQSFLKHELNLHHPDAVDGASHKDPRTIMTLHTTIQATMGPWFHAYGERLLRICEGGVELRPGVRARVAFGMTKHELYLACRDEHLECETYIVVCGDDAFFRHLGVIYFVDGQRWDAHMKQHMLTPKIKHYRKVGLHPFYCDLLVKLMDRRVVYGKGANQVVGEVFATVSSGDPDTLPGNCVKMVCALAAMTAGGDLWENATALGLVFEVAAEQRVLEDPYGDFCSCVIAGSTFISKPGKVLAKLPWVANPSFPAHLVAAAKVQCAIGDLKVFPEICDRLAKLRQVYDWESVPQFVVDAVRGKYRTLGSNDDAVPIDAALFFATRYGVDYEVLLVELDAYIHAALTGKDEVDMPSWVTVCSLDLGADYDTHWLHFDGALARRLNREPLPVRPPRRRVARIWNKLMHILNGNIHSIRAFLILCVLVEFLLVLFSGWADSREIRISRIYQRTEISGKFTLQHNMPTNKNKKRANKAPNKPKATPRPVPPRASNQAQAVSKLSKQIGDLASKVGQFTKGKSSGPMTTLGTMAGKALGSFLGTGDYVYNDTIHTRGTGKGRTGVVPNLITNCEYVRDIVASGDSSFQIAVNTLHPTSVDSSQTLFPWLTNVAKLYTKYRFRQLIFEYRSMSSEYSSAVGLGTIIMAPQYNVDAPVFTTKQQMEAATHAVAFKPSNSAMCGVECAMVDANVKWYNIRNRSGIARTPMTDMGNFSVAIAGIPTTVPVNTTLGELWVHYTIELIEPVLAIAQGLSSNMELFSVGTNSATAGIVSTSAFGIATSGSPAAINTGKVGDANARVFVSTLPGTSPSPSNTNWYIAMYLDQPQNVYFSQPGRYVLTWNAGFTTAPTTWTTTGTNMSPITWTASAGASVAYITGTKGSASDPSQTMVLSTDKLHISYSWYVVVPDSATRSNPVWITASLNATGGNLAVLTGSSLLVSFQNAGAPIA